LKAYCVEKNEECPIKDGNDAFFVMFAFEDDQLLVGFEKDDLLELIKQVQEGE